MHPYIFGELTNKLVDPSSSRENKPRYAGKTMVMDKGLGWHSFEDLLETTGPYIDYIKIGFGSSVLYPITLLQRKIELAKTHDIVIMPGGTFLELAIVQHATCDFFEFILHAGFTGIEISDGTIELSRRKRSEMIVHGVEEGLHVLTEVGKKTANTPIDWSALVETYATDIEFGATHVTIESRESGRDVGIFDERGICKDSDIEQILTLLPDHQQLLWEAPQPHQQLHLLQCMGAHVNLGNIAPQDVMSLECLRRGLRSDTLLLGDR
jgi:phosphosulfolactate synthase